MANVNPIVDFADFQLRVTAVAKRVEAKVREINTLADEFRDVRLAAQGLVSSESAAAKVGLLTAERCLREAGEWIDREAKEVIAGNEDTAFAPISSREATNLLHLEHYPKHKKALEDWQRREEVLSGNVFRRETRFGNVTNGISHLIWEYSVFLGVVLTAVSQLSQTSTDNPVPVCGKVWFPIALTGFSFVVTIYGILDNFKTLKSLDLTIQTEKLVISELRRRALTLRRIGPRRFCFDKDTTDDLREISPRSFKYGMFLLILLLIAFSFIFISSYFVILCDTWTVRNWDKGLHR